MIMMMMLPWALRFTVAVLKATKPTAFTTWA